MGSGQYCFGKDAYGKDVHTLGGGSGFGGGVGVLPVEVSATAQWTKVQGTRLLPSSSMQLAFRAQNDLMDGLF